MSDQPSKKPRTLQQENRVFQSDWEEKYFQIEVDNKASIFCPQQRMLWTTQYSELAHLKQSEMIANVLML